ncbi:DUF6435 family protein [Marinagarivorans algicola]|uniref:DUF6435 family protein n=1 Tax=Marinagarivorans algicola TaxID=1513270 RepID=UPI0012E3032D|nr:DUF6435 family protein [Marinagarivorans algicola]
MFGLFKKDPIKKLNDEYTQLLNRAMQAQRSGDIRTYSELSQKAEDISKKIETLEAQR